MMNRLLAVLARALAVLARAQKGILVAEVVAAGAYIAVDVPRDGEFAQALWPWQVVVALVAALLSLWTTRRRPATLVTTPQEQAFEAPPSPAPILAFTALTPIIAEQVSTTIDRVVDQVEPWWLDILTSTIWVAALVLAARLVWRPPTVRLSPDGIVDRRFFAETVVPWDAVDPEHEPVITRTFEVTLTYRRPELVQGRRQAISAWNVDTEFLARVLHEYARHTELRPAIGTAAELDRLTRERSAN